jgi:ABC-type uncharacterized transport system substrate-binding protein
MELIRSAASNLVELNPDAILATGGRVIPILMELTRAIPVVVVGGVDPVARGYAESLAHPGGNVTGFAAGELSVIGKMLQTLKEIAPQVSRVSMLYNPDNPATFSLRARLSQPPGRSVLSRPSLTFTGLGTSSALLRRPRSNPMAASLLSGMSP